MRLFALVLACGLAAGAQSNSDEDFKVYTETPRLLLKAQRMRLLKRERERQTPRWRQLEMLIEGNAQLSEPAFALGLFHAVTGDAAAARRAIEAARKSTDPRQQAVVLDWCGAAVSPADRTSLEAQLKQAARAPVQDFASARNVAFAALTVGDAQALRSVVVTWWRGRTAKELIAGSRTITHADLYPMIELFHAIRDNLQIDLRDDILPVFKNIALQRLLSYYPAVYPAAENEYRIPYYSGKGEPDLRIAALCRAAELALVAFDNNAQELQFLQGWLMHDRFVLRGTLGAPYEFLWANPYQPGLPFEKMPLVFHDKQAGALLARSSWDEDAVWLGIFGRSMQMFRDGGIVPVSLKQPLVVGDIAVSGGSEDVQFRVTKDSAPQWFIAGLKPGASYNVEIDDEDMTEGITDRGGILPLEFSRADDQLVRIREWKPGK